MTPPARPVCPLPPDWAALTPADRGAWIEAHASGRDRNGRPCGYTAAQLAAWGVNWPPVKGWKAALKYGDA